MVMNTVEIFFCTSEGIYKVEKIEGKRGADRAPRGAVRPFPAHGGEKL